MVKQSDLARLANVSVSTVSRALSGHPSVNRETQERVRALAEEHAFRPNQLARNLRLGQTGAIGLVLPLGHERGQHLSDPFFLSMLGLLADQLTERGYDILLSRVIPIGADWLDRLVDSGRIEGLVLIGQSDQYDTIERVAHRYRPMVVWGVNRPGQRHVTVGSDNVAGGAMAAARLAARGATRLLFVGNPDPPEFAERLQGFRAESARHGAQVAVLRARITADDAYVKLGARLTREPAPDGIFAASDVVAMGVLRALADYGLDVPGDVAVIGFDDVALAAHTRPTLTTIAQDLTAGAPLLAETLLRRMAGEEAGSVIVPCRLVARESG